MTATLALDAQALRELSLRAGADDVGVVRVERPEVDADRKEIEDFAPWARTLVSFVVRMNREPIRTPARSVARFRIMTPRLIILRPFSD